MKKIISNILLLSICLALLVPLTGCQDNEALIADTTNRFNNTYWTWIDTSPLEEDTNAHYYAHINEDGSFEEVSYSIKKEEVILKYKSDYNYTWQVIMHRGKPCVKITTIIKERENSDYILADIDKEGKIENLTKSMYLPGSEYYNEDKIYAMTELSQEEYETAIKEAEEKLEDYKNAKPSGNSTGSFTNKYGTSTTKCAHSGCTRYIASSGDTNCCTVHSRRCLKCSKYIDEDAMYCMSCLSSAIKK